MGVTLGLYVPSKIAAWLLQDDDLVVDVWKVERANHIGVVVRYRKIWIRNGDLVLFKERLIVGADQH